MMTWILAVLGLFVGQTLLPSWLAFYASDNLNSSLRDALGPRDTEPAAPLYVARAKRALNNMHEALPVFITLALLVMLRGEASAPLAKSGATLFFFARLLYVPAYLLGVPGPRSALWAVSGVGLGLMAYGLLS